MRYKEQNPSSTDSFPEVFALSVIFFSNNNNLVDCVCGSYDVTNILHMLLSQDYSLYGGKKECFSVWLMDGPSTYTVPF